MAEPGRTLVMTIGTGTADELEATVLEPCRKSLETGEWARVVLLPSQATAANAELLRARHPGLPIEVRPLGKAGDEENVDSCFGWFDGLFEALAAQGIDPETVVADFTRGTKAMSAALALAAASHRARTLRYVGALRRDGRGMAAPGFEIISDIEAAQILERQRVEWGRLHLRAGHFAATAELFPGGYQTTRSGPRGALIQYLLWAGEFWGAWDRFDYPRAAKLARRDNLPKRVPAGAKEFLPSPGQEKLIAELARPLPSNSATRQAACRALAADLLANAWRRFAHGQHEEVLVRAYRVLELVGQYRLFAFGLDSDAVDAADERVRSWRDVTGECPTANREGKYALARERTASLLQHLGDPMAECLSNLDWVGEFSPRFRNRSILIHGFKARTRGKAEQVRDSLERVQEFFAAEHPGNHLWLETAQFPFFAPRHPPRARGQRSDQR